MSTKPPTALIKNKAALIKNKTALIKYKLIKKPLIKKILACVLALAVSVVYFPGGSAPADFSPQASAAAAAAAVAAPANAAGAAVADANLTVISPRNVTYVTEKAFVGSLERTAGHDARLDFPNTVSVLVPRDGLFVGMAIKSNEWIEKGDPIATFAVVPNELEIDETALALELAETSHRRTIANLEAAVEAAYASAGETARSLAYGGAADENTNGSGEDVTGAADEEVGDIGEGADAAGSGAIDWHGELPARLRPAQLAILAAEENLNFTLYNGERDLEFMRANLADLRERSEDFIIYAPISGYVYDVVYFSEGRSVPRYQFVCRISDPDKFQVVINASGLTQLRLGAPVSIETSRRDAPTFPGRVIGNTTLLGNYETEGRAVIAFEDPQSFLDYGGGSLQRLTGLRYRVQISQSDIKNVLLAPRRAISTESTYRFVNILEDGLSKKRYVLVGLSNMEYMQILDGVKAGDDLIMN